MRALRVALCLASVVLTLLALTRPATASERLSVFMLAGADDSLADNLVEVSIARLSGARDGELVGMRELEDTLKRLPQARNGDFASCVDAPDCLAALGERAGTPRAVIGRVERRGQGYALELSLVDTRTHTTERRSTRATPETLDALIAAVEAGVAELFELAPGTAGATPRGAAPVAGAVTPKLVTPPYETAGIVLTVPEPSDRAKSPPPSSSVAPYVGFMATGLAVVAFSTAAVAGSVANSPPNGNTRKLQQEDLARRQDYAVAANVAFVAGGVFSAVAIVAFVWH